MFDLYHRINRILIKLSYRLGVSKLFSMPKMLALDPTNLCDLKCPLCPTGLRDKTVERGSIKLEQFKTIIDQLAKHLQSINLYSWGEPLLHKSLVHMIRHAAINTIIYSYIARRVVITKQNGINIISSSTSSFN